MKASYTIWVCTCCMLLHANGECCESDEHGGDSREPLSLRGHSSTYSMGMDYAEHAEDCDIKIRGEAAWREGHECDCEENNFSWSSCEGCGSSLGGSRYALTVWED